MSDDIGNSSVQDRYAPQFAQELARNEQEQKELEARLAQLREDHTALSGMLAALGHETTPKSEPAATPASVTDEAKAAGDSVPQQRRTGRKASAKKATGTAKKAAAPKKPATAAKKAATKTATKSAAKNAAKAATKPAPKTATKAEAKAEPKAETKSTAAPKATGGPTLQDVIAGLLGGHSPERRTVREIFDELKQNHPERASSTQSVRNALNGLLRKGAIEREEKQGAVWFGTAAPTTTASPAAPTDTAPVEPAEEKAKAVAEA
ncbi:hypothetical protein [Streptomyces cavernicola]|uniref:Regulatory protein n=1 Tax=Streptomyces cavernicola TaxID=3043613 RepID=A0ABT6S6U1_9ACTN|nr:hypothetical protein [Streptomyces sp. B-S-A6]MDI3403799.1 hypothetical protein [Streptomyces sp. B-S-A6]